MVANGRPQKTAQPLAYVQPGGIQWQPGISDRKGRERSLQLQPLIRSFSRPEDVDAFIGSGSTLVAAALSGRRYLSVLNPKLGMWHLPAVASPVSNARERAARYSRFGAAANA